MGKIRLGDRVRAVAQDDRLAFVPAALPEEAELTRVVHVTLIPDDEYASTENLDINIYGDFIFCRFLQTDGSSKICRADCSLKNLDDFLKECAAVEAQITPAPTVDPFAAEAPRT